MSARKMSKGDDPLNPAGAHTEESAPMNDQGTGHLIKIRHRARSEHLRTRPSASSGRPWPPSRVARARTTSTTLNSMCTRKVRLRPSGRFAVRPARSSS